MKHQIAILGDGASPTRIAIFQSEVERVFTEIGLNPTEYLEILSSPSETELNWRLIPVFIWFGNDAGSATPRDVDNAIRATTNHLPIFPIVDSETAFTSKVPKCLHPINGFIWQDPPSRLINQILQVLGLTWSRRRIFISYKRSESAGVASQLFAEFGLKGYSPFLDSASVEGGTDFQESLWHQLADTDLIIFIDSPSAISSKWVRKELGRANALGISTLQVVWPGHKAVPGSDFCDRITLTQTSFSESDISSSTTVAHRY